MLLLRVAGAVLLVSCLAGCGAREKRYLAVTDPDAYWDKSGYSIKAPSGNNWYKLPQDDKFPNAIMFFKGEALVTPEPGKFVYMKGTGVSATSTILDEAVPDRKDKNLLAGVLLSHLKRYQKLRSAKITTSNLFTTSGGLDCLKYNGSSALNRVTTEKGDIHGGAIKGYLCLHPERDNFGVIMESRDVATVWTDTANKDEQTRSFFRSLRFNAISSPISRSFKTASYQIGKAPFQIADYQEKLWVVLKDEDRVVQVDPATGLVLSSIAVGREPIALALGESGMWVANSADGTVTHIDNKGHIAATIPVGGRPVAVSIGLGQVWVADAAGNAVIRINPASNKVAATFGVGRQPLSLAAASDGIWVANAGDGTVSVIHRTRDWTTEAIQVGGRPVHISLADTGAWVADESGKAVVRIARKSKTVTARIEVGRTPNWIKAFNDWDLFVSFSDSAQIVRIDPDLNRVFGPPIPSEAGSRSLVEVDGSLWFANAAGTSLTVVNLNPAGQLLGSTPIADSPDK